MRFKRIPDIGSVTKFIYFFRLISADIVLGAIGGLYFAARVFHHEPSVYFYITLASAVWVVYIADHIFDGIRTKTNSTDYIFHYKNRKILISAGVILVLISACFALFYLEDELIIFGISTFILVLLYLALNYFFRNKQRFFPKELLIALIYTWGIFGGVILITGEINLVQLLMVFNFFLVVMANVLLFSYTDMEQNKQENYTIISTRLGTGKARKLILLIILISIVTCFITGFLFSTWEESLILILMNLTLLILLLVPALLHSKFSGLISDAVFIYPLLLWLF